MKQQMQERYGRIIAPIVVQLQTEKKGGNLKGFQIYSNGHNNLKEVAKAVRAEILRKRGIKRDCYWGELVEYGEMKGTDPLFYNSNVTYPGIFWGSLKHPKKQKSPFSAQELQDILVKALDRTYFPEECKKSDKCRGRECPYFYWKLFRCRGKQLEWKNRKVGGHSYSREKKGTTEEDKIREEAKKNGIPIKDKKKKGR